MYPHSVSAFLRQSKRYKCTNKAPELSPEKLWAIKALDIYVPTCWFPKFLKTFFFNNISVDNKSCIFPQGVLL